MYVAVRYDMADEKGETRRQRNARFGATSPEAEPPEPALHVWAWFWEMSSRRRSGPEALSFAEVGEWQRLMGIQLLAEEVAMLMAMDDQYLRAVRDDQAAARGRAEQSNSGRG